LSIIQSYSPGGATFPDCFVDFNLPQLLNLLTYAQITWMGAKTHAPSDFASLLFLELGLL